MGSEINSKDITILCKVVDNFGDIGVVYRLARALSELSEQLCLRIVVDNLQSFSLLEPKVNPAADIQMVNGWQIFRWDSPECTEYFRENPPHIILECFQCGRPEWLENLLFTETIPNVAQIIMLDYLTAEPYAETFHKLLSLTRSSRVKKINFMPGFTPKTGGLILDKAFVKSLENQGGESLPLAHTPLLATPSPRGAQQVEPPLKPPVFKTIFFSYPKDWAPAVSALQKFSRQLQNSKLKVFLAKGAGFDSFYRAYTEKKASSADSLFELEPLNFIPQTEWDALLCSSSLLFIRGEDSLSRAALWGVPYLWHAYPQTEDYQLVKVQALLDAMKPFFSPELFGTVETCWQIYNGKPGDLETALTDFLSSYEALKPGFKAFSESLLKNGNLAKNLLDFIEELCASRRSDVS